VASEPSQLPNVTTIIQVNSSGTSHYNGLQASQERRFTNGLAYSSNTTWAHGFDNMLQASLNPLGGGQVLATAHIDDYGNGDLDTLVLKDFASGYLRQILRDQSPRHSSARMATLAARFTHTKVAHKSPRSTAEKVDLHAIITAPTPVRFSS
jgi:hypothetical protein